MSIINPVDGMYRLRNQTVHTFGHDQTGNVSYTLNSQGFRSNVDFDFIPEYCFFGCSLVFGVGVNYADTFASMFPNAHNYGLVGEYANRHVLTTIKKFVASEYYKPEVKLVVVWTDRDQSEISGLVNQITNLPIHHFFCGDTVPTMLKSYKMVKNLDYDVSGTHIGPKTHKFMYKLLCNLL